jgi:ABC-2 type transport system permease protein
MTLIGTLLTALVVSREWERGTMEALMATPVKITELLLGKLIPYYVLGMGSMMICFLVSVYFYHVPFRGSLLVLLIVASVFLLAALALGLLISTIAKNQFVASQVAMVAAFLPSFMLSGFIFEITTMPPPIRAITYLIPASYFVPTLQTLFLVGNVWKLIAINLFFLTLAVVILFSITAKKTVKRLD